MHSFPLWMTRLMAPLVISLHALGILLWLIYGGGADGAGVQMIAAAWVLLIIFSVVRYLQGDFIQRALNIKPWNRPSDETLLEQARMAMTRTAMVILFLTGALIGIMWTRVLIEPSEDPAVLLKTARGLLACLSFVGLTGTALPAAIMAWSIPPLDNEGEDGE